MPEIVASCEPVPSPGHAGVSARPTVATEKSVISGGIRGHCRVGVGETSHQLPSLHRLNGIGRDEG
jgi:hypothetical protein